MTTNGRSNGTYYGRSLISSETIQEICAQKDHLLSNPFCNEVLREKQLNYLFSEANVNSARLEADLMSGLAVDGQYHECAPKRLIEETARDIGRRVTEAWNFGFREYKGELSAELITSIGKIIEPITNGAGRLRDVSARVGPSRLAIDPSKLKSSLGFEGYLDRFIREVNEKKIFYDRSENSPWVEMCPVQAAIYTHFMNFYLQPNFDGNKRTGRVLQNLILRKTGLPPPAMFVSDNAEYNHKMVKAFDARRIREGNPRPNVLITSEEHDLFEFLGVKLLNSLTSLNDFLDAKKVYYVPLETDQAMGQHAFIPAKNALTRFVAHRDPQGMVRYDKDERLFVIRGNVAKEEIAAVMDSLPSVKSYSISPRKS